jgi:aminoglycoside phosphotransferase (APT) family kinase protein
MPIPDQRDLEATRRAMTDWLSAKLPDARGLVLTDLVAPTGTGYSNDTLLFDASWREGGDPRQEEFVARIRPSGYQVFPETDVALQYQVMRILGTGTDVPVPHVFWLEEDTSVLGQPFFLMRRVHGEIPSDSPPFTMEGFLVDASPADRERSWNSGIDAMARVHDVTALDGLGLTALVDKPAFGPSGLAQQLGYYEGYFAWAANGRPQPVAEAAWEWLHANRPTAPEPLRLCWGDSRISNQIFRDFECVSVIDWEMVTLGNPVQDVAWWIFLDRHWTEGIGIPRLEGFPSYDDTIGRWEQGTGLSGADAEYYGVFAGFRFAVIMMRIAQMMVEFEVLPADTDLETNNIVTQILARQLGLPSPGDAITL